MAQEGMEHWHRAVRWTGAGIFAVAVAGGLVGTMTRGSSALDPGAGAPSPGSSSAAAAAASSAAASGPTGSAVSPATAAWGSSALLQLTDLPTGWMSGQTPSAPTTVSPWSAALAGCIGIPPKVASVAPTKVDSPEFTSADKLDAVEDSVSVFPSASVAQAEYAAMADARTVGCMSKVARSTLQSTMQRDAGSSTTVGSVSFSALPAGAAADHLAGFTVSIPLARSGRLLTVTSTQVDFVVGALVHQLTFNGNGTAFPAPLEEEVLAAAEARQ
jgi:hypothetical protein